MVPSISFSSRVNNLSKINTCQETTETINSNINTVGKVIEDNLYVTYGEIEAKTSLSKGKYS